MSVSTENAPVRRVASAKPRPGRELVVALFYGPLADRLAQALRPLRVPPPSLVLANAAAGFAAAVALHEGALAAAALLLQLKTLLDNADGRLARISGRETRLGRYLDTEADFVVNVALFGVLGSVTGEPWLALAAFAGLTILLSVNFIAVRLYREAHARLAPEPPPSGHALERALERVYRVVFAPQDRLLRAALTRRLERLLEEERDPERRRRAVLAYHDRATMTVLANFGLSTQLVVLGACLVLHAPSVYLWFVVGSTALLPLLQLRREWLVRRALSARRAA
jgi:archaetidylinositol phosphate synthase